MAAKHLLPGHGGKYTSETFTASSGVGADTIDCTHCGSLAIQVSSSGSPGGNIDIRHSFNLDDYADLFLNIAVTDGTVLLADAAAGPFGILQIDATDVSAGSVTVTIVGYPRSDSGW